MTKNRIKYNFTLNFPAQPFTLRQLCGRGNRPKYITAYMRVRKARRAGVITVVGEKASTHGRSQLVFCRTDAKHTVVSTAVPVAT